MMSGSNTVTTEAVIERHDKFLSPNYLRNPIVMVRGEGSRLWDADGKEYLDLFAGFGAPLLGHCHPDLVAAVTEQAQKLWHPGVNFHTEPQTHLAESISVHGFGGKSFFSHSGADANEAAIKLARLHGGGKRFKIITTTNSFHGRSMAAMMATGQPVVREGYQPWLEGFAHVPYNDLAAMREAVDDQTIAIMLEPIQGEGGINVPDDDYFPGIRALCDEKDLLLICDEVWTGCGRTGRYFAHQHWDIEPDIMTLAKGVGGGLPVGVMCAKPELAETYNPALYGGVHKHVTTLGGNCLSMAVSAEIFRVLERDNLVSRATELGERARARLGEIAASTGLIKEVRGLGLFIGAELDPDAADAWFADGVQVVKRSLDQGLIVNAVQKNVLRVGPALTMSDDEMDASLDILESVLTGEKA